MTTSLYEKFHSRSRSSIKLIGSNNFTYRLILGYLNKYLGTKKLEILDYGCGVGAIDLYLASLGHEVVGLDISKKAIITAAQSAKSLGLADQAKFYDSTKMVKISKNQKFNLIICTEVIEHLEDDRGTVKKLIGLLKSSGILFITTPSLNAPLYKLGLSKAFDARVGHLRRYDPEALASVIKDLGMHVEKVVKTEGIIRNALFVNRSLGELIRFVRGPISDAVTFVDDLTVPIFGESDIMVIARKP